MAKKNLTKSEKPAYTLLLKFNSAELKQLAVARIITAETTSTKAIIKCLYNAEYFMKEYKKLQEINEALSLQLNVNKNAILNFTESLKGLHELNETKQNTKGDKRGKRNLQLSIED